MSLGPQLVTITLTAQDPAGLEAVTRKATSSQRDSFRARLILLAADGYNNTEIATELSCTRKTVRKWRGRFAKAGRAGALREPGPAACPPIYDDSVRALITAIACELPSERDLPLSRLSATDIHMVAVSEIDPCLSPSTIPPVWARRRSNPGRVHLGRRHVIRSSRRKLLPCWNLYNGTRNDKELTDRDVVICADEKTAIKARSRHRSSPGPGTPMRVEHEYDRHGGCTYQAVLIASTGEVYGHCVTRNTRANFERLVADVMTHPICSAADRVFWIIDNGSVHHPNTFGRWLT